jgi:hypothetical protein
MAHKVSLWDLIERIDAPQSLLPRLTGEVDEHCLETDSTSCHIDDPVTRTFLSGADGRLDDVDERERAPSLS